MMQVVVSNLCKKFGTVDAIKNVSFCLPKGGFLSLLGPSGSGKTTTLMAIAGFVEPDSGRIDVAGRDVTRLPPNKRDLGVVFQSYALFPHKTVADNVAFPLAIRGCDGAESRRKVASMLNMMQLSTFADRAISTLSGGQKQRVALARALVFEPPVLLMDEPLGALDKKLREQMQAEIKKIQNALGVTSIFVTHDQDEALMMSDVIAVMEGGEIVQIGTPRDVYDHPATRFVAEFLGGVNLLPVERVVTNGNAAAAVIGPATVPVARPATGPTPWLGIRPERVRIRAAGSQGTFFAGEVLSQTFVGSAMIYSLRLEGGQLVTAKIPRAGDGETFAIGATVGVAWGSEDAWLLSAG